MNCTWKSFPLLAAAVLLAGCGSVDRPGPDSAAPGATASFAGQDGRALPDWHPPLPPGHPQVPQGPTQLPPGHPAVPEGLVTCPGSGAVREPEGRTYRDFKADPGDVIRI